ncbi:MAG: 30S ribosomal protein S12 methylthiotransferase RimO [Chloroflexi bacterium]|nr:30S ribosomal protein S12 methylthiotransferase RimO [Chloroflexota bacterium]
MTDFPLTTYHLLTLGCAKNVADSDGIGGILDESGYASVADARDADVLIVNTCGFLQASRKESLGALRELAAHKRDGQVLIAAGCLISRYGERVQREVPEVDAVIDAGKWLALPRLIQYLQVDENVPDDWLTNAYAGLPLEQLAARSIVEQLPRAPHGPSAYLKIADGCDRPCTFCIIPTIKGAHRSKPADAVIAEARDLVARGVQEIILVAQDTTAYGWDLGMRDALAPLIERICNEVEGLRWLRLMYAYPGHITPRLIETMARLPQVVHYLDVPLQHAHAETLKRMKRPNIGVMHKMLDDLRAAMPDLAIRTTFIVGFPGETDDEFNALLEFLNEQQFDRVGVFEFSREDGTPAAYLENQVAARVKKDRREQAMAVQQKISLAKNRACVGKTLDVLIEGVGDGVSIGRTYRDAPEVDGVVLIQKEIPPGKFARAQITGAMEYDLTAQVSAE